MDLNTTHPVRSEHVRERQQGEELAIFDIRTASYSVLNPTATRIWELCDGSHSIQAIAEAIHQEFPGADDLDIVVVDVKEAIDVLCERQLVTLDGVSSSG